MLKSIEIRCPGRFGKLFLILRQEYLPTDGTFMEIACMDCAKEARADYPNVRRALHYYDLRGVCVMTKLMSSDAQPISRLS